MFSVFTARPGHQHRRDLDLLRRAARFDLEITLSFPGVPFLHARAGDHIDAPVSCSSSRGRRRLAGPERQDPRECFESGYLVPKAWKMSANSIPTRRRR